MVKEGRILNFVSGNRRFVANDRITTGGRWFDPSWAHIKKSESESGREHSRSFFSHSLPHSHFPLCASFTPGFGEKWRVLTEDICQNFYHMLFLLQYQILSLTVFPIILIVTLTDHSKMVSFHRNDNYFTKTKTWLNICNSNFRIILTALQDFN